jgi:hypothetical protein
MEIEDLKRKNEREIERERSRGKAGPSPCKLTEAFETLLNSFAGLRRVTNKK